MGLPVAFLLAACGADPSTPRFTLAGVVLGVGGTPLAGAVVSDGQASTLSGEDGRFRLAAFGKDLTATKPGCPEARLMGAEGQDLRITLREGAALGAVALDRRGGGGALGGWKADLVRRGFDVRDHAGGRPGADVRALVMVTAAPTAAEVASLQAWVRGGGRLVVCAEWGGYPDQSIAAMNALMAPAGLAFTGATVKQPGGADDLALVLSAVTPGSLSSLVSRAVQGDPGVEAPPGPTPPRAPLPPMYLAGATSVELDDGAVPILRTAAGAYTVLAKGTAKALAAVAPLGKGKVFAVGDSSMWRDDASAGDGSPDWQRGANMALAAGLLRW